MSSNVASSSASTRWSSRSSIYLAWLPLLLVLAPALDAQTVTGRLVDAVARGGIDGAQIFVTRDVVIVTGTLSDEEGAFEVRLPSAGTFTIETSRQGYADTTREVTVAAGETLSLGDVPLEPAPISLGGVRVEAERPTLTPGRERIRERQLRGRGTFLSGAMIADAQPRSLAWYLAEAADLWVRYDERGRPSLTAPHSARRCVRLFINQWPVARTNYTSLDDLLLRDIAAIEIYDTHRDVPPELTFEAGLCGAVNVWTWDGW